MRRRNWILGILVFAAVMTAGCGKDVENTTENSDTEDVSASDTEGAQNNAAGEYQKLTAEEAYARMNSGDSLVILDVRTAEEYAEKHIPGAMLIPNETIGEEVLSQLPDLDAEILVYCRSGNRSKQAVDKMIKAGYTNVYDFGGINDWPYEAEAGEYDESAVGGSTAGSGDEASLANFTAEDIDGNTVTQEIFKDYDLTMINIWATFCGPCIREMPELGEIHAEYADQGFQVVGIVVDVLDSNGAISDKQVETARDVVEETGASYLHLLPSDDLVTAKLSSVYSVPETIFVDSEGNLVGESYIGSKSGDDWKKIIDALLDEVK